MINEKRSSFTGKIGFVLAAAGSAVGLGNIWRFPYLAAKYGGGIFLLTYLVLAVTLGFALMTAEIALGRKTGLSVISAYKSLDKKFAFVGYLAAIVPAIILPYYSVIGGWIIKYIVGFYKNDVAKMAQDTYFSNFITSIGEPLGVFSIFLVLTALVVWFGVEKGVEKVSKVMMPALVVLSILIPCYILTMPGAIDGVVYYLKPDFSKFSATTVLAAMGQLFYSMSLAMGIMVTYGSYIKKEVNLEKSVSQIEVFDTGFAFLAGLMVVPAVFVFSGGTPEALGKGAGLMFETLPKVFHTMAGGRFIGFLFFVLVFFAAITSSISLMETVVSILCDKLHIKRKLSVVLVFLFSLFLGVPSCLGYGVWSHIKLLGMSFLDFFDFISNSVLMPVVAFLTCIFIGYVIKPKTFIDEIEISSPFKKKALFSFIIRYAAPICIILILISSMLDALGTVKI